MSDVNTPAKSSKLLLYLVLAGGAAYFAFGNSSTAPAADSWLNTTPDTDKTGKPTTGTTNTALADLLAGTPNATAPDMAAVAAPITAPLPSWLQNGLLNLNTPAASSATSSTRPGYPLDNDDDIRFSTAARLATANDPGGMFNREWGEGSRNIRVNMARVIGQQYHIYADDLDALLPFRFNQGGFGSWDDMYRSFTTDPGSLASVLAAYNQSHGGTISPRW
jgi:hypothetical protein